MTFKVLRKTAGMDQVQLAEKLGVSNTAVSMWETGAAFPRVPTLYRLSELLGVPMDEVVRAIEASRKGEG